MGSRHARGLALHVRSYHAVASYRGSVDFLKTAIYAKKAGEVVCVMVLVQLAPEPGVCDGSWRVLTGPLYIPRG